MGAVKPNKFTFLASRQARDKGLAGFRYVFIKDRLGPKSVAVYTDMARLLAVGFINSDGAVSAIGKETLDTLDEFFGIEPEFTQIVDRVARDFGGTPRARLVDQVHAMTVQIGDRSLTIDDVPKGTVLLDPRTDDHSPALDESWGESLEMVFEPETRSRLSASAEDVRQGRLGPLPASS